MRDSIASGDRLRELRIGRGLTQEGLVERAGLSVGVVKKIERGGSARIETYHALARALAVRTSALFESDGPQPAIHTSDQSINLMPLRQALSPPAALTGPLDLGDVGEALDMEHLRATAQRLAETYSTADYPTLAELLPALVRSANFAVDHHGDGPQLTRALQMRSDVLKLAGRYLSQVRVYDLANAALTQSVRDAVDAGDRLEAAQAVSVQVWPLVRQGRFDEAERLAVTVADQIEPRLSRATRKELGVWGGLLLGASSAAVRNNRPAEAREMLRVARGAVGALGGATFVPIYGGGRVGAVQIGLRAIENHMTINQPRRVLGLAERVPAHVAYSSDGWRRHRLTVAQAHVALRQDTDALTTLEALHGTAPEWLRHQRLAADVFRDVRKLRARPLTKRQRALGQFLGVQ